MHRVLVPAISLIRALAAGGAGAAFFTFHKKYVDENRADALRVGAGAGGHPRRGGFHRPPIAGMSKVPHWVEPAGRGRLRRRRVARGRPGWGGNAGLTPTRRYLHLVHPVAMVLIGVEIILNILLGLPPDAPAGEMPRPRSTRACLSFIATPDRLAKSIGEALNYQFGFNVTDSWVLPAGMRLAGRLLAWGLWSSG